MSLFYRVFGVGVILHELAHYAAARAIGVEATVGLDDGRAYCDVRGDPSPGAAAAIGLAPVVVGVALLGLYLQLGSSWLATAPWVVRLALHAFVAGSITVVMLPSPSDLAPLVAWVSPPSPEDLTSFDPDE